MVAPHMTRFAAILSVCSACALFSSAALGQADQGYSAYRQALLAQGWKPVTSYGLKTATGKTLYKYPEVICGPALCNAKWRDSQGREQLVRLIRGVEGADHRVAPR
ncbi:hypothetical protein V3H18_01140 [Methylocystis sp. 9N]|uniref:Uncharacterized protein n=1 Tax=Methylocystis borbori TaxID=3118750 RepID=A0ABU7XCM0_9HYPH